jgi:hypothetical protein
MHADQILVAKVADEASAALTEGDKAVAEIYSTYSDWSGTLLHRPRAKFARRRRTDQKQRLRAHT